MHFVATIEGVEAGIGFGFICGLICGYVLGLMFRWRRRSRAAGPITFDYEEF
ncbi:MAG TPA: hypothetical protein VGG12_06940 [Methylovirgula sp.]|jgi:hypothetical protein